MGRPAAGHVEGRKEDKRRAGQAMPSIADANSYDEKVSALSRAAVRRSPSDYEGREAGRKKRSALHLAWGRGDGGEEIMAVQISQYQH